MINHKSLSLVNEQIPFIKNYEKKKRGGKENIWRNKNDTAKREQCLIYKQKFS